VDGGVIRCCACTVFIGPGYATAAGFRAPDSQGVLCGGCVAALHAAMRRGKDAPALLAAWRRAANFEVRSRPDSARAPQAARRRPSRDTRRTRAS
jgi:hypothetical protein